jgi:hypothetical protein
LNRINDQAFNTSILLTGIRTLSLESGESSTVQDGTKMASIETLKYIYYLTVRKLRDSCHVKCGCPPSWICLYTRGRCHCTSPGLKNVESSTVQDETQMASIETLKYIYYLTVRNLREIESPATAATRQVDFMDTGIQNIPKPRNRPNQTQ